MTYKEIQNRSVRALSARILKRYEHEDLCIMSQTMCVVFLSFFCFVNLYSPVYKHIVDLWRNDKDVCIAEKWIAIVLNAWQSYDVPINLKYYAHAKIWLASLNVSGKIQNARMNVIYSHRILSDILGVNLVNICSITRHARKIL